MPAKRHGTFSPHTEIQMEKLIDLTEEELESADAEVLQRILPKLAGLEKIIATAKARAKELLTKDPKAIPGWGLREGAKLREVVDARKFVERLLEMRDMQGEVCITAEDLLAIAKFSVTSAEDLVGRKAGLPKKMAGDMLAQTLGDALGIKQNAPSLIRLKD